MTLKYFDLQEQYLELENKIDKRIKTVLSHGKFILGPEVDELEQKLCDYTQSRYCITCGNGTDALQIALMAIGIQPGDEVITPAFSYIAAAEAIKLTGATPVFVDVDLNTFNLSIDQIIHKITARTKAIIPVSLYGQTVNFDELNKIAKDYNLIVIEDAAQSFGAEYNNTKSCNLSDISCTSFFPTKPLGAYGDGGAIFTSNEELASAARRIARHGQTKKYYHTEIGMNSRLDTVQAAVLLEKINILDSEIARRDDVASYYNEVLERETSLLVPKIQPDCKSAWAQYTIRTKDRINLQSHLASSNIPSMIHYPIPVHQQPAMYDTISCPNAELLSSEVLSLPVHSYLKHEDIDHILGALVSFKSGTSSIT